MEEITLDISEIVQQLGCQPILFVGSGLAKRYFSAPNWDELLTHLANQCSLIDKGLGFYKQSLGTPMAIGEAFAQKYQEWAWTAGQNDFPKEMFSDDIAADAYIKFKISQYFKSITPKNIDQLKENGNLDEIIALQAIKPHAIITTNYDQMIEALFPDLEPIVGQQILKSQSVSIGEIFKIHGCVSDPSGLVFTSRDYEVFAKKKKFLSAKLLTFFNEHPLIFIGYSATDPNIRAILSDIDEALPEKGGIIPNVYILKWNSKITEESNPARETIIATEEDRSVRVKLIEANQFDWVFDAFSANPIMNDVNPRALRALVARSYDLVRHDIPKSKVEADFQMLNSSVENSTSFAKLFGVASIKEYSAASAHYKFSTTQLGKALGGRSWHLANQLIERLKRESGWNMKSSDNIYHRAELVNKTKFHKYSEEALVLLGKIRDRQKYELQKE
ncbi:hypothetical protein HK22_13985 [Gluconobacter sp. DsW_056]|nr:hypothetical protein HK22_13985 [Gluconobacter sp. DsW_056]